MNLLVNAGIPVRTVSQYKIMHDKVIIADGRNIEVGFNYTAPLIGQFRERASRGMFQSLLNAICSTGHPLVAGNGLETGVLTHLSHKTSINTVHLRPC
jgi:hypothetical protein